MATLQIKDATGADVYLNVVGSGSSAEPYQSVVPDYRIPYAINQIFQEDAVTVSVAEKGKKLIKFGQNSDIDAAVQEMVWEVGGFETYQTSNAIDEVVSSNAGDTQEVVIEGHTLSGSDFTFVTQTATLNGTTGVVLTTPLARANRMYNNGATDFAGTITVYENGGTTHLSSGANGDNQSLKCATTTSSVDYWIITSLMVSVNRANTAVVDFVLQVREYGKVFRTSYALSAARDTGTVKVEFEQPLIVKPNSDIRLLAESSAANTVVQGAIHGYLAIIT
jgi:hypothetical protein